MLNQAQFPLRELVADLVEVRAGPQLNASEEDKDLAWRRIIDLFGVKNGELRNLS